MINLFTFSDHQASVLQILLCQGTIEVPDSLVIDIDAALLDQLSYLELRPSPLEGISFR